MAFKRKRTYAPRRAAFKKRKFTRKRNFRRGSGNGQSMTRWSSIGYTPNKFRGRKLSKRSWNHMLWNNTLQKPHYRSLAAVTNTVASPASLVTATVQLINADDNGIAFPWEATGGARVVDTTVLMPIFNNSSIIIRGGLMRITATNAVTTAAPMKVEIFGIRSNDEFDTSGFPGTVPVGWDPSNFADFNNRIGRIVTKKTFIIGNQDSVEMSMRRPIMKIDYDAWLAGERRYYWVVVVQNLETAIAQDCIFVKNFSFSFVGDVDG